MSLVSVCVPAYQAEATIHETIASVIAQTHCDFELVVADDHSTDATVEIAKSFDDPRIRVELGHETLGMVANFERVLRHARGDFVKLLCADDLISPDALGAQLEILSENPAVVLTSARRDIIGPNSELISPSRGIPSMLLGEHEGKTVVKRIIGLGYNPLGEPACVMFRSRTKQQAGPFSGQRPSPMDMDMWIRMLRYGRFFGDGRTLASFRLHPRSHTSKNYSSFGRQDRMLFRAVAADPHWGAGRHTLMAGLLRSRVIDLHRTLRVEMANRLASRQHAKPVAGAQADDTPRTQLS